MVFPTIFSKHVLQIQIVMELHDSSCFSTRIRIFHGTPVTTAVSSRFKAFLQQTRSSICISVNKAGISLKSLIMARERFLIDYGSTGTRVWNKTRLRHADLVEWTECAGFGRLYAVSLKLRGYLIPLQDKLIQLARLLLVHKIDVCHRALPRID